MGRSVWTHSDAIETVFFPLEEMRYCDTCDVLIRGDKCEECGCSTEYDEDGAQLGWVDLVLDIRETLKAKYPSFIDANRWPERESHCIVENDVAQIVISEYCGLVSLGIVPVECDAFAFRIFNRIICSEVYAPFVRKMWGKLEHIGTMSNGEAIYQETS